VIFYGKGHKSRGSFNQGCTPGFLCLGPHLTPRWALKRKLEAFGHMIALKCNIFSWSTDLRLQRSSLVGTILDKDVRGKSVKTWSGEQITTILRSSCQSKKDCSRKNPLCCHHLFSLMSFQTYLPLFLLCNTEEDSLNFGTFKTALIFIVRTKKTFWYNFKILFLLFRRVKVLDWHEGE